MSAAPVEPSRASYEGWDYLVRTWQELDVPEGWRAEIEEGQIVLVPPPAPKHNVIAEDVQRALYRCLPDGQGIYQTLGVNIAPLEKLYIPDLVVIERALLADTYPGDNASPDAADALLVVEVTSESNARDDRTKKLWGYAHAPVPLYLLIDRWHEGGPTTTLFSEPSGGVYQSCVQVPFGKPIALPEPFGAELETHSFPH